MPYLLISKILEKAVASHLGDHLHRNVLGFFSNFLSVQNTSQHRKALVNSPATSSWPPHDLLLDLSADFDTIDLSILMNRLEHVIGIKGTALGWFKSYLSDRFKFIHVNDVFFCTDVGLLWRPTGFSAGTDPLHSIPGALGYIIQSQGIYFNCYAMHLYYGTSYQFMFRRLTPPPTLKLN